MELNPWIESFTGDTGPTRVIEDAIRAVSALLGVKERTVKSWYRRERIPSFRASMHITKTSHGVVDWNGIYTPYARAAGLAAQRAASNTRASA